MHKMGDLNAASQAALARQHEEQVPPDIDTQDERRQLNVLFCDMVGFTGLASGFEPEILQKIIRVYEDAFAAPIARIERPGQETVCP